MPKRKSSSLIKHIFQLDHSFTLDQKQIEVQGWVRSKRISKDCVFLAIYDGSCQKTLQAVLRDSKLEDYQTLLPEIQTGCSVILNGQLAESPAKGQTVELIIETMNLVGESDATIYPLQKKGHSLEFLREIAHLRPRTNTFGAMFRIRHEASMAIHDYFRKRDFYWVHTPLLTADDCEGAGELFQVTTLPLDKPETWMKKDGIDWSQDFFSQPAYLTVSGQLQGEFLASALGRVYTFGPTFRAENSNTTRHLAEFWMIEPEVSFCNLDGIIDLATDFLQTVVGQVLNTCPDEIAFFEEMYQKNLGEKLAFLHKTPIEIMDYSDAIAELKRSKQNFQFPVEWADGLQTEHERYLCEHVIKGPLVVKNYPEGIKAFYMKQNDDQKTVAAMDLLLPGVGELMGGSQREDRYTILEKKMNSVHLGEQKLQWYKDLRRFGGVPHAGFGLGFERLLMYLTGMTNIKDTIPCPRAPQTIRF